MLRRLVLTAAASLTALGAAAPAAMAVPLPMPLPPLLSAPDSLTVTVADSGNPSADGTFRLECGEEPGGNHPAARAACERLEELSTNGRDPFSPVDKNRMCTQQHGGDATAHITGTWHGREVDARFARTNGCEIKRWDTLKPVLPLARS
ncbi:SSI family serine proteinase inhibitor [Streptomyces sp. SP18CS02]|uniref:SSI family serine proteinase inhibitor n=1 Tax=Streptomyces sp. SP18CS02 TaxID=3002531 RepID=UPI002E76F2BC|nr:SSI family serine proteinase inhibitor [Streptomyces sp. SP18CS02]MEE1754272.1 SSI family serine proteinase inhibitor [Streptomyces sp. SP18CS02]